MLRRRRCSLGGLDVALDAPRGPRSDCIKQPLQHQLEASHRPIHEPAFGPFFAKQPSQPLLHPHPHHTTAHHGKHDIFLFFLLARGKKRDIGQGERAPHCRPPPLYPPSQAIRWLAAAPRLRFPRPCCHRTMSRMADKQTRTTATCFASVGYTTPATDVEPTTASFACPLILRSQCLQLRAESPI